MRREDRHLQVHQRAGDGGDAAYTGSSTGTVTGGNKVQVHLRAQLQVQVQVQPQALAQVNALVENFEN